MEEAIERPATGEIVAEEFKDAGGETKKKMKVLVAVDKGEGSLHALVWALDHLFNTDAAAAGGEIATDVTEMEEEHPRGSLTLIHVQQPFQRFLFPSGPAVYASSSVVDSIRKAQEQNSNKLLSRALLICKEREVKAETLITDGEPKEMICQAAEQIQADVAVVGNLRGILKECKRLCCSSCKVCGSHRDSLVRGESKEVRK